MFKYHGLDWWILFCGHEGQDREESMCELSISEDWIDSFLSKYVPVLLSYI